MKLNKLFTLLFCGLLLLSSCQDEDDCCGGGPNPSDFSENFGTAINRDFSGQIVDTNDNPIVGATVKIGTATVQTDENGVFLLSDASVYQQFAYVTATKPGYVDGSRALVPTSGVNHVKIMMLPLTPVGTVSSGETGEIELANGTKGGF